MDKMPDLPKFEVTGFNQNDQDTDFRACRVCLFLSQLHTLPKSRSVHYGLLALSGPF